LQTLKLCTEFDGQRGDIMYMYRKISEYLESWKSGKYRKPLINDSPIPSTIELT